MKKLVYLCLFALVAFIGFSATTMTINLLTEDFAALTTTDVSTSVAVDFKLAFSDRYKIGLMLYPAAAGTITIAPGDYAQSVYGTKTIVVSATGTNLFLGYLNSMRFQKYDGYVYLSTLGLNGSKFYVFQMP